MYIPKDFLLKDPAIAEFIANNPFATLISTDSVQPAGSVPMVNFAPIIFDEENHCLIGHLANNNEQLKLMDEQQSIVAIFHGEDGYVSPSWYKDATQVPTWNFSKVEVTGEVSLITDDQKKIELLTKLSDIHEQRIGSDWTMSKLPKEKLTAMLAAITGFSIKITTWQGKAKLSQNKSLAERSRIIEGLKSLKDARSEALAIDMIKACE